MRKLFVTFLMVLLLTGCGKQETFETVSDEFVQPVMAQKRQLVVTLPQEAASPVSDHAGREVYICADYDIFVETMEAGDLDATVRTISGYDRDALTILETSQDGNKRYDFVWASAGEAGDRLGRAVILDDGNYHYCLSLLADAEKGEQYRGIWQSMFDSVSLD